MRDFGEPQPMKDPGETLKRLCQEAAAKVNREDDLTERERGLLVCVLGIRKFSRAVRNAMDEDGNVIAGFHEGFSTDILVPGSEIWDLVDELTECILDGIGEFERFDPQAVADRHEIQSRLDSLKTDQRSDLMPN